MVAASIVMTTLPLLSTRRNFLPVTVDTPNDPVLRSIWYSIPYFEKRDRHGGSSRSRWAVARLDTDRPTFGATPDAVRVVAPPGADQGFGVVVLDVLDHLHGSRQHFDGGPVHQDGSGARQHTARVGARRLLDPVRVLPDFRRHPRRQVRPPESPHIRRSAVGPGHPVHRLSHRAGHTVRRPPGARVRG